MSEFLRSLREENLITPKGEYEKDYILEVLDANESVLYQPSERSKLDMDV